MIKAMIEKRSLFLRQAFLLMVYFVCTSTTLFGQSNSRLSLEDCYRLAKINYPLVKQYALIEKANGYSIGNASKRMLPHLQIAGQATYQSDVTQIGRAHV